MSNKIIQINKFAKLHNGKTIIFSKTDFLEETFEKIRKIKNNVILITGNSDYEITDNTLKTSPKNIKKWYAQNANTNKINCIPIGIENHENCILEGHGMGHAHAKIKIELLNKNYEIQPTKEIYANFATNTNHTRNKIINICKHLNNVTDHTSNSHIDNINRNYEIYINNILDHKMVISPNGNGIDCHRTWETLYLNRVPIVEENAVTIHFKSLPIIYLKNWEQLNDTQYINDQYNKVIRNTKEMLDINYWTNEILSQNMN